MLSTQVAREVRERPERVMVTLRLPASRLSRGSTPLSRGYGLDPVCAQVSVALIWPRLRPDATPPLRGLCLEDRSDLTAQFWNPVSNDVPDEVVVDTEVIVNEPVAHPRDGAPLNLRVQVAKFRGHLLGGFPDDLEAPDECAAEGFVLLEGLERQPRASLDQVLSLDEDVPQVITRLEGHRGLRPESEDR